MCKTQKGEDLGGCGLGRRGDTWKGADLVKGYLKERRLREEELWNGGGKSR